MFLQSLIQLIPWSIKKQMPWPLKSWLRVRMLNRLIDRMTRNRFSELATEEDVYYCYRLLLGRNPDPDGLNTYISYVLKNESVHDLVAMFLSSPEFKNRRIFQSQLKYVLVELDKFRMYVSPDDWAVGKIIWEKKEYEPHVAVAIRRILKPGMVFVDVGANIGYFSLMAAQIVGNQGRVLSFEPNQQNCGLLHLSARSNGFENIDIYPYAVAEKETNFLYDSLASNGVLSEFNQDLEVLNSNRILVRSVRLDEAIRDVRKVHVIKIDVEGAEYRVLQGAEKILREHHPILFSEFSPGGLQNVSKVSAEAYLQVLIKNKYDLSILESPKNLLPCKDNIPKIFEHLKKSRISHLDIVASPREYKIT